MRGLTGRDLKGRTLTTSVFSSPRLLKWVMPLNRSWFEDENNGIVCHDWMNHSRDLSLFRSKLGKIRHFEYDVSHFHLHFLCGIFFNVKSSLNTFQICIGWLPGLTVGEIMSIPNVCNLIFLLSQHFFCNFKWSQLANGKSR